MDPFTFSVCFWWTVYTQVSINVMGGLIRP